MEDEEKLKEEADAQTAVLEEETNKTDTELANNTEEVKTNEETKDSAKSEHQATIVETKLSLVPSGILFI
jgi:hypothetical protein